jgi:hypothetical protein
MRGACRHIVLHCVIALLLACKHINLKELITNEQLRPNSGAG